MSNNRALSILTAGIIFGLAGIEPATAKTRWQKFRPFQQKIQPFLAKHRIKIGVNYSPPKFPVAIRCDTKGNTSIALNPGIITPVGRFGIDASRQLHRKCS